MSSSEPESDSHYADIAPGYERIDGDEGGEAVGSYLIGLGLAIVFFRRRTTLGKIR